LRIGEANCSVRQHARPDSHAWRRGRRRGATAASRDRADQYQCSRQHAFPQFPHWPSSSARRTSDETLEPRLGLLPSINTQRNIRGYYAAERRRFLVASIYLWIWARPYFCCPHHWWSGQSPLVNRRLHVLTVGH